MTKNAQINRDDHKNKILLVNSTKVLLPYICVFIILNQQVIINTYSIYNECRDKKTFHLGEVGKYNKMPIKTITRPMKQKKTMLKI